MSFRELTPWNWFKTRAWSDEKSTQPLMQLQNEIDDLFHNFSRAVAPSNSEFKSSNIISPKLDISENEKNYLITAEIPGVEEKDIEIAISNGVLTIKGEKKEEKEEKTKQFHRIERSFGSF